MYEYPSVCLQVACGIAKLTQFDCMHCSQSNVSLSLQSIETVRVNNVVPVYAVVGNASPVDATSIIKAGSVKLHACPRKPYTLYQAGFNSGTSVELQYELFQ